MKRFLIIALVVVFAVVIMAVPAFASGYFTYNGSDGFTGTVQALPSGTYTGRIYADVYSADIYEEWINLEPFEINAWTEGQEFGFDGIAFFTLGDRQYSVELSFYSEHDNLICDVMQIEGESADCVYAIELVPYSAPATGDVNSVLAVFSIIGDWMILQIPIVLALFWNAEASQLTVLGAICICALGVALVLLLLSLAKRWIQFR